MQSVLVKIYNKMLLKFDTFHGDDAKNQGDDIISAFLLESIENWRIHYTEKCVVEKKFAITEFAGGTPTHPQLVHFFALLRLKVLHDKWLHADPRKSTLTKERTSKPSK